MFVIYNVKDNAPFTILGVHHDADAAYRAFKAHLQEAFQGEPMTDGELDAACELGYEPWGNGFIAIMDLSNAESDNPNPQLEQLKAEFSIMARACGNWREWPGEAQTDHNHPDWKAAARAILERNALKNA